MTPGTTYNSGDVVLARVQFTDTFEIKQRPAVVLFSERDNIVVAGVTSNLRMEGIPLYRSDGALKDSVIKPNYIFTIAGAMILKKLFSLSAEKKRELHEELVKKLRSLDSA